MFVINGNISHSDNANTYTDDCKHSQSCAGYYFAENMISNNNG